MEKNIIQIDALPQLKRKLRVAAYARVSSSKDAMLHSLSAQVSYYNKYISSHDDWEFVGIYADEGISGTKEDRDEFQRMINDCRAGKIDLILTKAISRFARNTMTMLEIVRELKNLNVDVFFEEQNLHSISSDGEMVLTLLASVAQEEARSVSENQKWRIRKDFEKGLIWGGKNAYGYRIVNKKMVLVPEEAKLVKRIFQLYIGGLGFHKISKLLNDEGIPAMRAKKWNKQSLQQIIANINYTGDLLLQKTYRENYLTKKKKINKGELDQFFVENDHEAIITRDEYYAALEIRRKRVEYFKLDNFKVRTYPLTGFVRCGNCGKNYNHKKTRYTEKWSCVTYQNIGKSECDAKSVPDAELTRITLEVLNIKELDRDLIEDKLECIEVFKDNKLLYRLLDGKTVERTWNDISRRDSWTEEMKKEARRKSLAYIGKEE